MVTDESQALGLTKRLSRVESDVAGVLARLDSVEQSLERISVVLERLADRFTERIKPQWSVLIGLVMMIFTIGGVYSNLSLQPIKEKQQWIFEELQEHTKIEGHLGMKRNMEHTQEDLTKLDEVLQREMRLLDDTMEEKLKSVEERLVQSISNLDKTLQREMSLQDQILKARIDSLKDKTKEFSEEQKRRTARVYKSQ